MRHEDQLKERYGSDHGMSVPEGYFEQLELKIMEQLPPYKEAERKVDLSLWQKVKPYVYLAAMFAGIWLMMKVFHTVSSTQSLNLDNPPAAIASAMALDNEEIMPYFTTANDMQLEEEMSETYSTIEDFAADFGYEFEPEYASIEIPATTDVKGDSV